MTVVELGTLPAPDRTALVALLDRAGDASGHPSLPEPQQLALNGRIDTPTDERIVLARQGTTLSGFAVLSPTRDAATDVHVVVDPAAEGGPDEVASALLEQAVAAAPPSEAIHLWVMQATAADDARVATAGFVPTRDLLQMRVPLPLPGDVLAGTRPLATRSFVPGQDEEAWVETNNRAFADHPEQGGWTVGQLRERMAADWVDLDDFLVADDPDGPGLIGACWTKIHRDRTPVLGEIYVIDVDPRHHGHGWGRSLTVAGLVHLAGRGITVGMLYTDASNVAAVGLYRSLGFTVDHIDRSYTRHAAAAPG